MAQTFTASATAQATTVATKYVAQLWVGASPAKIIRIRRVWVNFAYASTTTVTGVTTPISLYKITAGTRTAGTANTNIVKHDTANATALDAAVVWETTPTWATPTQETHMKTIFNIEENSTTTWAPQNVRSILGYNLLYDVSFNDSACQPITLRANQALAIFQGASVAVTGALDVFVEFTQE